MSADLDALLNQHFAGRVVRKDLTKQVKEGANVPVYVLEYLLGNYCASNDPEVIEDGLNTVKKVLADNYVRPDEAEKVKSKIRERGSLKIIDKVTVTLNEKRDVYEALLSNLGTKGVDIPTGTVKKYEKLLADLKVARDSAAGDGDCESEDLMIGRIQVHEKTLWMLDAYLK